MKKIYIASDHAGYNLKNAIVEHLKDSFSVEDLGPENNLSCDYPDSAKKVTDLMLKDKNCFGILVCGSGVGMSMAANRVKGIRAVLASCEFQAKMSRLHNDANVLCLGERVTGLGLALSMVDLFLNTEFEGGRHQRRVDLFD